MAPSAVAERAAWGRATKRTRVAPGEPIVNAASQAVETLLESTPAGAGDGPTSGIGPHGPTDFDGFLPRPGGDGGSGFAARGGGAAVPAGVRTFGASVQPPADDEGGDDLLLGADWLPRAIPTSTAGGGPAATAPGPTQLPLAPRPPADSVLCRRVRLRSAAPFLELRAALAAGPRERLAATRRALGGAGEPGARPGADAAARAGRLLRALVSHAHPPGRLGAGEGGPGLGSARGNVAGAVADPTTGDASRVWGGVGGGPGSRTAAAAVPGASAAGFSPGPGGAPPTLPPPHPLLPALPPPALAEWRSALESLADALLAGGCARFYVVCGGASDAEGAGTAGSRNCFAACFEARGVGGPGRRPRALLSRSTPGLRALLAREAGLGYECPLAGRGSLGGVGVAGGGGGSGAGAPTPRASASTASAAVGLRSLLAFSGSARVRGLADFLAHEHPEVQERARAGRPLPLLLAPVPFLHSAPTSPGFELAPARPRAEGRGGGAGGGSAGEGPAPLPPTAPYSAALVGIVPPWTCQRILEALAETHGTSFEALLDPHPLAATFNLSGTARRDRASRGRGRAEEAPARAPGRGRPAAAAEAAAHEAGAWDADELAWWGAGVGGVVTPGGRGDAADVGVPSLPDPCYMSAVAWATGGFAAVASPIPGAG